MPTMSYGEYKKLCKRYCVEDEPDTAMALPEGERPDGIFDLVREAEKAEKAITEKLEE